MVEPKQHRMPFSIILLLELPRAATANSGLLLKGRGQVDSPGLAVQLQKVEVALTLSFPSSA